MPGNDSPGRWKNSTHARARTLAATRLATLQLAAEDLDTGARTANAALQTATQVRSARITHSLATLRATAYHRTDQPTMQALIRNINAAIGHDDPADTAAADEALTS
jgi:hypothetical protein